VFRSSILPTSSEDKSKLILERSGRDTGTGIRAQSEPTGMRSSGKGSEASENAVFPEQRDRT
jgi:hypothetical protein